MKTPFSPKFLGTGMNVLYVEQEAVSKVRKTDSVSDSLQFDAFSASFCLYQYDLILSEPQFSPPISKNNEDT